MEKGEGAHVTGGHEGPQSGAPTEAASHVRRIAVFVDYWYVYTSARQLFAPAGAQAPTWFGNVTPAALARTLVKRPPAASRRSERRLEAVHIFIRHYDPAVHRGQQDRVDRWTEAGAAVHVGPPREEGGGFWQSSVSVDLATAVASSLAAGACDTAIVFAGDAALAPLFTQVAGADVPSSRVELATWVGPDGTVPTSLVAVPGVWCHRLGEASFKLVIDDRRQQTGGSGRHHSSRVPAVPPARPPGAPPRTAMAAALVAAGVVGGGGDGEVRSAPAAAAAVASAGAPVMLPASAVSMQPSAHPPEPDGSDGVVRRFTQRLFKRGA